MSNLQLEWSEAELLASDPVAAPLVAAGRRCHGGLDESGRYVSPRGRFRNAAIASWQEHHRTTFGTELLDAPLETWPESYPNVAQARFLLREGVRDPVVTVLTRIGTAEGFGGLIRYSGVEDFQAHFDEPISRTAIEHLHGGLFEAHARDETGWEDEAGHKEMWFAARDLAFEHPVSEDETAEMLRRLGVGSGGKDVDPELVRRRQLESRLFDDIDFGLEMLLTRMINLLLIEISAFHLFAWAEALLADSELVAGDGEAARLVACIRQDETPHVEYLRTVLTEMRDRTFVGTSGRRHAGTEIIGALWDRGLDESLGARRDETLRTTLAEVELALQAHPRRDDVLEEFHALGSIRPDASGVFVAA